MTKPKDHELLEVLVPFPDPMASALWLDAEDLVKQPGEILRTLEAMASEPTSRAYNDPTCRAWRGCEGFLAYVGVVYSTQVLASGIEVPQFPELAQHYATAPDQNPPAWWGDAFHEMIQGRLARRRPEVYSITGLTIPFVYPGAENRAFQGNREIQVLEQSARLLQQQASEAWAKLEEARRRALRDELIVDRETRERKSNTGLNGWGRRATV